MSEKKAYVLIEGNKGTRIRGYDSYLCPWDDFISVIEQVMDNKEVASITLTDLSLTEEEFEDYCCKNEIEWGEI